MARPLLLDLFCGAGGAARGYVDAGFDVVGVDVVDQPRYPFAFERADALDFVDRYGAGFEAVHASPPCQRYSVLARRWGNGDAHPDLVAPTRRALQRLGRPWVIENVPGAPLVDPVMLCGTMFPPLRVIRHRLFEAPFTITAPAHGRHPLCYTFDRRKAHFGRLDPWVAFVQANGHGYAPTAAVADAMGIEGMTLRELSQAIPPAYTRYVGGFLAAAVAAGLDDGARAATA